MHLTKPTQAISKYGNVFAEDLYTLGELVNHQITKGFQPVGPVAAIEHGGIKVVVQTIVQYSKPVFKKQSTKKL
jgi:hypothetical protein